MRKIPRVVVIWASARLASTFSFFAASGSAVHESGKRFAAQCTTTDGLTSSSTRSISPWSSISSLMTPGEVMRLSPVPTDFQPSRKNWRCTCRPSKPLACVFGQPEGQRGWKLALPPVMRAVCDILLNQAEDVWDDTKVQSWMH
jgi:hypothetical protein